MNQQHTPEPWEVSAFGDGLHAHNIPICQFFNKCGDDYPNREANARRIVACVNACVGIPNEQLECDNVAFVKIFNERNALKKQRDALLALLQNDAYAISFQTLGQYRSAIIAAVKGGAA